MSGPNARLSMGEVLEECRQALNREVRFTWVPEAFLFEHGVSPWTELPLWVPVVEYAGVYSLLAFELLKRETSKKISSPPREGRGQGWGQAPGFLSVENSNSRFLGPHPGPPPRGGGNYFFV